MRIALNMEEKKNNSLELENSSTTGGENMITAMVYVMNIRTVLMPITQKR